VVYRAADFSDRSMNANPVGVLFHDYSSSQVFSSDNVSLIEVSLRNIAEIDLSRQLPLNFTTVCENRRPVVHTYQCPAGLPNVTVTCTGEAKVIQSHCPGYYRESICVPSIGDDEDKDEDGSSYNRRDLKRISYDEAETICTASWPVIGDQNLLEQQQRQQRYLSSGPLLHSSTSLTSRVETVSILVQGATESRGDLSTPQFDYIVVVALSVAALLSVLLMHLSEVIDQKQFSVVNAIKEKQRAIPPPPPMTDSLDMENMASRRWVIDEEVGASHHAASLKAVLRVVLPEVFRVQPFLSSLFREFKHHHRWLGIVIHYSEQQSRLMRLLAIITHSNLMLLLIYACIHILFGADGHCYSHFYEKDCLEESSVFDPSLRRCQWNSFYNTCTSHVPTTSAITVIAITCICQMVSIPIAINVEH